MNRPRIAVIGSSNTDLATYVSRMPAPGETIEAPSFEIGFGGKGANQAVAAAKLGAEVVMVAALGDDLFGDNTMRNFTALGMDASHVRRVADKPSGVATILVDPSGENRILIVKGANGELSPADVERAGAALRRCDLILLQLEVPLETVYAAIRFGKAHGVKTVLNPAPATPGLDIAYVREVSYFIPNESELAILTGMKTQTQADVEAAAQSLIARGVQTVIVTLGGRGALLATAAGLKRIAPTPVTPLDTTGAGDAFVGAFARYHAAGASLDEALTRAARYAADSVTRKGAQGSYATEAEFEAFERGLRAAPGLNQS
ncbi:MAG TPA: ribokinase [Roseiarcus sp.]|nr:ribokinase [Roseiarcus sp.]